MNAVTTADKARAADTATLTEKIAENLFYRLLSFLQHGQITIIDGKRQRTFGNKNGLSVELRVLDRRFYRKVLFGGSIGAGETYIANMWDVDNLTTLIRIMALNMDSINRIEKRFSHVLQPLTTIKHRLFNANTKRGAKKNIISHYDLGNELYKHFLDPTMMYSSAMYKDEHTSLEEASLNKLDVICRKINLKPGDEVIEIGTGWGGFAIHAATHYGCRVTTTTISEAQHNEARQRIEQAGLTEQITLLKNDYRELDGKFDKLVSIEMIEAVGHKFLPQFFNTCSRLLKQDGKMLIQAITIRDQAYHSYVNSVDFIQKHIFPGGCIPSNQRMFDLIAAKTDMVVRSIDDFGLDYARTLRDWRIRFNDGFHQLQQHGFDETFKRLWNFYLSYCEGGFLEKRISVVHLMADKPQCRD